MSQQIKETWESYASSWRAESATEKRAIFTTCMDTSCVYNDPLAKTQGWDALIDYMLDFHKQIPGGHFVTTYFLTHNNKSIAKWDMKNAENNTVGDGISYGEYNNDGKLISMTGFFDTPE